MHSIASHRSARRAVLLFSAALLAGCTTLPAQKLAEDEAPVVMGSGSRHNFTPMEPGLLCLAQAMRASDVRIASVTVGDVKDYTGKYSQNEGNAITQGGSLMIYSALGKLGDAIRLQERFDTRIAELELAYADRRQLGDGQFHAVEAGKPAVPWVPYFGGSILRSDYYIVGGITELNYNIASRGVELNVSAIGGKQRTFTMNVGVDLRIIDSRSLLVLKTVSMQKQITGEEVGAGVFRFFGNELLDVNVGAKSQEPLQLGVRTAIEHGVVELIAAVSGLQPRACVDLALSGQRAPEALRTAVATAAATVVKPVIVPVAAPATAPVNASKGAGVGLGASLSVAFEPNSSTLDGTAHSAIGSIAKTAAEPGSVNVELLTRESENLPPSQRQQLSQARVRSVTESLVAKGVAESRIRVEWIPNASSPIERQGAGMQVVARLKVLGTAAVSGAAAPDAGKSALKGKATSVASH